MVLCIFDSSTVIPLYIHYLRTRHDNLDILINNAGRYEVPDTSSTAKFGEQADLIINTNYWGLKRVRDNNRN